MKTRGKRNPAGGETAFSPGKGRLLLLTLCLLAGFSLVGARLYMVQVTMHDTFSQEVEESTTAVVYSEAPRGDIRDVRGNLLATSSFVKTVCADPALVSTNRPWVVAALSPLLGIPAAELERKLELRMLTNAQGKVVPDRHVILKRRVPHEQWLEIHRAMTNLNVGLDEKKLNRRQKGELKQFRQRAVYVEPVEELLRVYPHGSLMSHVIGHVQGHERQGPSGVVKETIGVAGVETAFNQSLTGARGWRELVRDRKSTELAQFRKSDIPAVPGLNVVLTLDLAIQEILEQELAEGVQRVAALRGSGIVLQPATGRILAMANYPTFDPNHPGKFPAEALPNRILTDPYEPGSTFKIVPVAGALNEGLVDINDPVNCENGAFRFGGRVLHDLHKYGVLTIEDVIAKSSNIGAAKMGIGLGPARLHAYVKAFGFGQPTGIQLTPESTGGIAPVSRWSKPSVGVIPMGHEVLVTPLQISLAMAAIANDGVLMKPLVVDRLEDEQGRAITRYAPQAVRRVVSQATARSMVQALKRVVSTNGTANAARLENFIAAGKTGTAEKLVDGKYSKTKNFSSFIGFFPADEPELLIAIFLDEPHEGGRTGGATAAPVFKRAAERAATSLGLRPTLLPAGPSTTSASGAATPSQARLVQLARESIHPGVR